MIDREASGCDCGRPSWRRVTDLSYELWKVREAAFWDEVDCLAAERYTFYRMIGGSALTLGAFRRKVRHELSTGEKS